MRAIPLGQKSVDDGGTDEAIEKQRKEEGMDSEGKVPHCPLAARSPRPAASPRAAQD